MFQPLDEFIYNSRDLDASFGHHHEYGELTYRVAATELAAGVSDNLINPSFDEMTQAELKSAGRHCNAFMLVLSGNEDELSDADWQLFAESVEGWIYDMSQEGATPIRIVWVPRARADTHLFD